MRYKIYGDVDLSVVVVLERSMLSSLSVLQATVVLRFIGNSLFLCRIIGLDYTIEQIADNGRCLAFSDIENVSVSYLEGLIPHAHLVLILCFFTVALHCC